MAARHGTRWPWIASGALHLAGALVAARLRHHDPPPAVVDDVRAVDLDLVAPDPPPPAPVAPPESPPSPPPPPPSPRSAARADSTPRSTRAPGPPDPTPPGPVVPGPAVPAPAPAPAIPTPGPPTPSLRAADILRASNDATLRGASEGWVLPPATSRGPRDIFGGGRGPCTTPECLAAIASAPTREGLAANPRDHRPAGSGRADSTAARRAIEGIDLVRSVRGIGRAVASAPVHTVPGQRRTVGAIEGGVAEEFDYRHGSSFSGMTFGASTSDLRYRLLRVELEVEQDAAGAIRSIRVSNPSGFQPLDLAATRALREALDDSSWRAGSARWTRWRLEVSEAVTGTPFANNDDWVVYGEPADGTRVRVRMRLVAQRVLPGGDAGA